MNFEEQEQKTKKTGLQGVEKEMLLFIHEFGFCVIKQIMRRFGIKRSTCYNKMQLLVRLGFVSQIHDLPNEPTIYLLSRKGVEATGSDLSFRASINLWTCEHQLKVIDVYLHLRALYRDATWLSERRLLQQKNIDELVREEHLPDGVLLMPNAIKCAIEVELTLKSQKRLYEIANYYHLQRQYQEVWYFANQSVIPILNHIHRDIPFIKVFQLEECAYG